MTLQISIVPYLDLAFTLPLVSGYLTEAANRTKGRSSLSDIARTVFNGAYTLWLVFDPEAKTVHGCFITEIKTYPQMKMLCIQHCAIDEHHMAQVEEDMQPLAARFAKDAGCDGIEFIGRPGWKKHAEKYGYLAQSVAYTKFLDKDAA